jgi:RHS repeat-associated protein
MQGTVPASSFSCSARRQERRQESPVCARPGRHSRRAFRKTCFSKKRAHLSGNTPLRGNPRTTHLGPFGEVFRAIGPMARANPFRFSTKYQDEESDLIYYGYRYYNPCTGRWLTRDPISEKGGLNIYHFARNNPIGYVDFLGLESLCYFDNNGIWTCKSPICKPCKCLTVRFGAVPKALTPYGPSQSNPAGVGARIPYTIKISQNDGGCKCKYIDNGTINASGTFRNGESYNSNDSYNNKVTIIDCKDGSDTPGIQIPKISPTGFTITLTVTYNWTGTLVCNDSDGDHTDTASLSKTFPADTYSWPPGR